MISRIELHHLLPDVFRGAENDEPVRSSQIWLRDVVFKRGHRYLIEAESGTGKSSLLSFIYGNRNDYSGRILFDGADLR
ncbi:MAG: ATP-binding cassette domain-containing protein, partial [Muribaculaceae bacterium]|nr:ATP-binding cassette domain-containing protein [Muribaculaceae bacterium]